jgi:hypothetical protein
LYIPIRVRHLDDEKVAESGRLEEILEMVRVEKIEAAVGQNNSSTLTLGTLPPPVETGRFPPPPSNRTPYV